MDYDKTKKIKIMQNELQSVTPPHVNKLKKNTK